MKKKKKKITHVFPLSILRGCFNLVKGVIRTQVRRRKVWKQFEEFSCQNEARGFPLDKKDCLFYLEDATANTGFDRHYTYHPAWAARVLAKIRPAKHIDVGSIIEFSTLVSAFVPVEFYDYRPANIELENLKTGAADINKLPFADCSVESISCMHVLEHIGLGRYGDPVDASGDVKAISELKRVVAPGGNMLLVVPLGCKAKTVFNGQRIYSRDVFLQMVLDDEFTLEEFSFIGEGLEDGGLIKDPTDDFLAGQDYGCGCFWFSKKN